MAQVRRLRFKSGTGTVHTQRGVYPAWKFFQWTGIFAQPSASDHRRPGVEHGKFRIDFHNRGPDCPAHNNIGQQDHVHIQSVFERNRFVARCFGGPGVQTLFQELKLQVPADCGNHSACDCVSCRFHSHRNAVQSDWPDSSLIRADLRGGI